MALKGLTWDHPRGWASLREASRLPEWSDLGLTWQAQPLEGFESASLEALAEEYDLLVIDHPHLGEADSSGALRPLDGLFDPATSSAWRVGTVGASYDSYRLGGRQLALPIDASAQVAAYRRDLVARDQLPATWDEAVVFAGTHRVALSLAGPHALLSFASICVALGERPGGDPERFISRSMALHVLGLMRSLNSATEAIDDNPIGLLERMSRDPSPSGISYCPLVFGYVGYSRGRLRFADAPAGAGGGRGSTLGGTGIALSHRCDPTPALLGFLSWLMGDEAQVGFIPRHEGQPASRAAWDDDLVNRAAHGFYHDVLSTVEDAWVRPQYDGFVRFQSAASQVIRAHLCDVIEADRAVESIESDYRRSRKGVIS